MGDRLLISTETRSIRLMPCGKCGAKPPYADGQWTQKHRINPGSKGGRYTLKNTVPRCPPCHAKEPGHKNRAGIMISQAKRCEGARKGARNGGLSQPREAKVKGGLKGGLATWVAMRAKYSPEEVSAIKRRAGVKSNHLRWHINRGVVNPKCTLCKKGGVVTILP